MEDGVLIVVQVDGTRVRVAPGPVGHHADAAIWSPDGRRLLYVTETDTPSFQVWDSQTGATLDLGREIGGLLAGPLDSADVTWSPGGSRLLFRGSPDGVPGVSVMDVLTEQAWQVTDRAATLVSWLDEQSILLSAEPEGQSEVLSVVEIGPPVRLFTETLTLAHGLRHVPHAISPDGRHLARFDANDPDSPRLVLESLPDYKPPASYALPLDEAWPATSEETTLLWSPDGRWIACSAEAGASLERPGAHTQLVDTTRLTAAAGEELPDAGVLGLDHFHSLAWSPDSRLLAGLSCAHSACSLSVVDVALNQVTEVASGETFQLWDVAWSPGGVYLAYSFARPGKEMAAVSLWDRGTGDQIDLMPTTGAHPITDLQWTSDGCRLYIAQREDRADSGLSPAAIWALGPAWEDLWLVAPDAAVGGENDSPRPCPAPLLAGRRLVAYYGTPLGPGLGVLGRNDIDATLALLNEQVQAYRDLDPEVETLPVFHMVTTIADAHPGDDGDYNHRVQHGLIRQWMEGVEAVGGWSILDVQPGRADLETEWDAVEPLLRERNVHLAVDPEFIVGDGEIPGQDLGRVTGLQVNHLQAKLDRLARTMGRRKLLVIHQFDNRMLHQKAMILDYPFVELVWDADGFGGPGAKVGDYQQYREEAGFEHGGFKLFYNEDTPLMTPQQVLSLEPPPRLVIYQ